MSTLKYRSINMLLRLMLLAGLISATAFQTVGQQLEGIAGQKPFTLHGNFGVNLLGYSVQGIDDRMPPWNLLLSAQATASVYGVAIPFSFRYSGKKIEYGQPFNQFGLSPQYKWLTLHGGYRTLRFSDFTLAGHSFLGGGVEMNPGKFRFGFVYGRFMDQVQEISPALDTLNRFSRKGLAMKIGAGNANRFIDFLVLRIQDDTTSFPDSLVNPGITPAQNVVLGINTRLPLGKKLMFETEVAGSVYASNMKAHGFEAVEELPSWIGNNSILKINVSSEFATAIRSSLLFKEKNFSSKLEYRRIDPDYKSMGAYYFTTDVEQATIAPSVTLFKRKLLVRGSVGVQRDNLRNTKKATTVRAISSASVSFNPVPAFGLDVNYSNYSNNQRPGTLPLIDSLKQYHTTANFSVTPRVLLVRPEKQHLLFLVVSRMELNDKNAWTALYTENRALILNLNYNLNLVKRNLTILGGLIHNRLENSTINLQTTGLTAGISKSLLEARLQAGWNNSLVFNHSGQEGFIYTTNMQATYQINKHHNLRIGLYLTSAKYKDETQNPSFHETKGDFGYVYTF
ncbi:MAG TPA: hypothetical protein P5228_02135 [Bacteroidales bacterium]|nr:hypothetical protein [Bacteroidales bacterium]HRZ50045.1 hypothetical protein [Bacteroidales bacterium]